MPYLAALFFQALHKIELLFYLFDTLLSAYLHQSRLLPEEVFQNRFLRACCFVAGRQQ